MSLSLNIGIVAAALSPDARQAAQLARINGFTGVLFDAYTRDLNIPDLSASGQREFRHVVDAENRDLVGLRLDLDANGLGPGADVDRVLSRIERAMDAAAALGSPLVCLDVGPLPEPPPQHNPPPKATPQQAGLLILPTFEAAPAPESTRLPEAPAPVDPNFVAQVDAALIELGRRADRYGVLIAMRSDLAGFAALERALRSANCPWFGLDLDPVAILRDEWDSDEVFSRLGGLIRHVRGRDSLKGAQRRTRPAPIGQGATNWPKLLADLDAAAYQGYLTIDPIELPNRLAAAASARTHLASL